MSLPRPSIESSSESYSVAASDLFVKVALEELSTHRETRKYHDLKDSCKSTLGKNNIWIYICFIYYYYVYKQKLILKGIRKIIIIHII